jgi:threonine synthase
MALLAPLTDPLEQLPHQMELKCSNCGFSARYERPISRCPRCGEDILEVHYDLTFLQEHGWWEAAQHRRAGLWRFRELLPIKDYQHIVTLGEGDTPLMHMQNLGAMLGLKHLYFKDERQNPTHSFKDRQATVAISVMREENIAEAVVASTGNVAIAYSAYAARAGIKLWAFMPSLTPNEKIREVAVYGTEVVKVTGTYDQTKTMAASFAERRGIFYDRGIKSLAAMESMKTMAFEIAQQLGSAPDWFIQGVSGGMGPIGVTKGFAELHAMGLVEKVPGIILIQSSGCAPMVEAFNNGQPVAVPVENPTTIIATLATANPGRAYQLLWDLMQKYGGLAASASDQEAFEATRLLARTEGLSVEPATAVALAGLIRLVRQGKIKAHEVVVFNCTGHTFPVETHILGDQWEKKVDLSKAKRDTDVPESSLRNILRDVGKKARKVVIIEDNEASARLMMRILQGTGHQAHIASDGEAGLNLVRQIRPDLIITDLMMPRLDGFQVIQSLKEDASLRHIPVIVLTAKELTVKEKTQLDGQVDSLLKKGSVMNEDLLQNILDSLN